MESLEIAASPFKRFQSIYSKKVRNLESIRNANASCSDSTGCSVTQDPGNRAGPLELIKMKQEMVLLMEQDLIMMRQLLTMHDKIADLKASACLNSPANHSVDPHSTSSSTLSLSIREEDYDSSSMLSFPHLNGSYSGHTRQPQDLYAIPQKVRSETNPHTGFDRNRSILRIPIPPSRQARHPPGRFVRQNNAEKPLNVDTDAEGSSSGVSTSSNHTVEPEEERGTMGKNDTEDKPSENQKTLLSLKCEGISMVHMERNDKPMITDSKLNVNVDDNPNSQKDDKQGAKNGIPSPKKISTYSDKNRNNGLSSRKMLLKSTLSATDKFHYTANCANVFRIQDSEHDHISAINHQGNGIDYFNQTSPPNRNKFSHNWKFPISKSHPGSPILRVEIDNSKHDNCGWNGCQKDSTSPRTSMDSGVYFGGPQGNHVRQSPTNDEIFI